MQELTSGLVSSLIQESSFYLIVFACFFVLTNLSTKLIERFFSDDSIITKILLKRTIRPIYYLLASAFLSTIISATLKSTNIKNPIVDQIVRYTPIIRSLLITFFITLSASNFIDEFKKNTIAVKKAAGVIPDIQKIDMLSKLCLIIVLCFTTISIMQTLGLGFGALATAGGFGGIIIGLSTKDLFANFFGLFSIYLDKPFVIGDEISILDNRNIMGYVEKIGLRITTLRTSNNKTLVYLPNSIFNTLVIENNTRTLYRTLLQNFRITHQNRIDVLENLMEKLRTSLKTFDFIYQQDNPIIKTLEIDSKTVLLSFKIFFNPTNTENFAKQSNIILSFLYQQFEEKGLTIISKDEKLILKENWDTPTVLKTEI